MSLNSTAQVNLYLAKSKDPPVDIHVSWHSQLLSHVLMGEIKWTAFLHSDATLLENKKRTVLRCLHLHMKCKMLNWQLIIQGRLKEIAYRCLTLAQR